MALPSPEELWMRMALKEAEAALAEGEAPVGAVIVEAESGRVRGRAHHQMAALKDPTARAVMIALTQLAAPLDDEGESAGEGIAAFPDRAGAGESNAPALVVVATQEPCVMSVGAMLLIPGVTRIVYGARDPEFGACGSAVDLLRNVKTKRSVHVAGGVLEGPCRDLLQRHALSKKAKRN